MSNQPREHRPQTVCQPSQPLIGVGSTFQYRNSASTDLRATFARVKARTEQAFIAHNNFRK
jgi:hypothetical protein